jgi:hypothetical protein
MARYTSADVAFLLVDGYSLLGLTTALDDGGLQGDFEEVTPLGSAFKCSQYTGASASTISTEGFYDDTAGSTNAALVNRVTAGTDRILAFGRGGNTVGADFTGGLVKQAAYGRSIATGTFHKGKASYVVNARNEGKICAHLVARTTGASTANCDFTAAATAAATGAMAYLELNALTLGGYTNLTVKVEHSANGSTGWADLAVFTASTTAPTAQRVAFTGTVLRYMRVTHAWTGAGTGNSATFAVGVGLT